MQYAADRLQGWLLNAKMQAKRDNRPTGIRINFDLNPTSSTFNTAMSMIYIQQPDDYAPPNSTCSGPGNVAVNNFLQAGNSILVSSQGTDLAPVQQGDYIEFNGVGPVYQITQPVQYIPNGNVFQLSSLTIATSGPDSGGPTPFRIRRAPRPQPGEEDLTLPDEVVLDLNGNPQRSQIRPRSVAGTQVKVYEVLFSPAGNVIGSGTGQTNINLWLTDTNDAANNGNRALLITVQVGSGLIGVNSVAPGKDPYLFTKDGRASGM